MDFEKLQVWQRSARLSADLYKRLRTLNDYGFRDQITRSGLSVPSNIAEGMSRASTKEKRKYLLIAKGSCAELRTQIYIGTDIGYIEKTPGNEWIKETREIAAMLSGLIRKLASE